MPVSREHAALKGEGLEEQLVEGIPNECKTSTRREVLLAHAAAITAMAIFGGYNVVAKVRRVEWLE
jgi:hypothetical protein